MIEVPALDGTAACTEIGDPDWWFPGPSANQVAAKAKHVCRQLCPVRQQCLAWAVATNERGGIWGGYGERERDAVRASWLKNGIRTRPRRTVVDHAEIVDMTKAGMTLKQIADKLQIGESTVGAHRTSARKAGEL